MARGNKDLPIETSEADLFGLEPFYKGLANYIMECETPMTIAIQGDWGSGKTSMINMVRGRLTESCRSLYFNTWHYAQFSSEDDLSISFLNELTNEVLKLAGASEELKKTFEKTLKNILKKTKIKAGFSFLNLSSVDIEANINDLFEFNNSFYSQIKNFKEEIKDAVKTYTKTNDQNRIVIFIDDLDRLDPQRAVELLEIIKIFLDVPGCVFVLAIDYEVVVLGVAKKYGDGLMFQKGKSFFDKMIQLPFRIPVDSYDMKKLLVNAFKNMGIDLNENSKIIEGIINNSVGANPRTVKRLMNTFELIKDILGVMDSDHRTNVLLLAILSIQLYDDALYSYLLSTNEWKYVNENTIFSYKQEGTLYSEFLTEKLSLNEEQRTSYNFNKTHELLNLLNDYIHEIAVDGVDESDFEAFINLLRQSRITGSGKGESVEYNQEILSEDQELTNKVIQGYKIDDSDMKKATSFTDAFVKILEDLIDESDFIKFVYNRNETKLSGLPDRMFYRLDRDKDKDDYSHLGYTKSSVKPIYGQSIILHYGRSNLKDYLLKYLKAFQVKNKIELVFEKSND